MYAGVAPVSELLKYAKVDVWQPNDEAETGYQRAPEPARIAKVAKFLQADPKPLMPTSVLLSYRGILKTTKDGEYAVIVDIPDDATLWVVDGQHRIFGLERAINELGLRRFNDYLLPIVITEFTSLDDEANQFRIINETMKKVRTDLARRILASRMAARGRPGRQEVMMVGRLWEANAVEVLKALGQDKNSPWYGRIQPPSVKKQSSHIIRELSFSTSLKPILNSAPYKSWPPERVSNALKAYWGAWRSLVPEAFETPEDYVLMKSPGVFSLHQLAFHVFEVLRARGQNNPTEEDFKAVLSDLGEYATAGFWSNDNSEGAGIAGSMKGFNILADAMQEELENAGHTTG